MSQTSNLIKNSIDAACGSVDLCLLLTATIDPEGMALTERTDPKIRMEDYKQGLIFWLQVKGVSKIVFCENSNSDLTELYEIERIHNTQKKQVEFLSFYGQGFPKQFGKGYGELKIISHAISCSKLIAPETKILKATGRYIIKNANELIEFARLNSEADIICDLSRSLTWSDSRFFACSVNFIKQSLIPIQERLDASKGINFEIGLASAVHRAMSEQQLWVMPPCLPEVSGVFGTTNTPYKRFFVKDFLRRMVYLVKRFFFSLSN